MKAALRWLPLLIVIVIVIVIDTGRSITITIRSHTRQRKENARMRLVMVRHGESDGNAGNPYEGAEPHLTERGRRQAQYAAERAKQRPYQALYTSPMSRALETACALAETT